MTRLRKVAPEDASPDTLQTSGMVRRAGVSLSTVGANKIWMGETHMAPGTVSGAHHHGENETGIYVVAGNPVFIFIADGVEERIATKPGDYVYVPPFVPHIESNEHSAVEAVVVIARSSQEAIVENLAGLGRESVALLTFRRASPEAAEELTVLTIASKAHWGYDEAFMEVARPSLTISREYLEANDCWIAEVDGKTIGWFSLVAIPDGFLLDNFFLLPAHIGSGVGRLMWEEAVRRAQGRGARRLTLEADPNAAGFYERMGARQTGNVTAPDTGRELPTYEIEFGSDV